MVDDLKPGQEGYPAEIIGYAEIWIVSPGDRVAIKVSCTVPEYHYRLVRLIQGTSLAHGPPPRVEHISKVPCGRRSGRFQLARPGSYAVITNWSPPPSTQGLLIRLYMQPWLTRSTHPQTLVSTLDETHRAGFSVLLNTQGSIDVLLGVGHAIEVIATTLHPREKIWSSLRVIIEGPSIKVLLIHKALRLEAVPAPVTYETCVHGKLDISRHGSIFIAASEDRSSGARLNRLYPAAKDFFSGRIADVTMKSCGTDSSALLSLDFARGISSDRIIDISGRGHDGVLVNAPSRGVTSHDWNGSQCDWTKATSGYGAIHFHDDDLDDADWETDFEITVPVSARSGAYAVGLSTVNGQDKDWVTFFVRHQRSPLSNQGKVCFIFPTFTYLAYANERLYDKTRPNTADLGPGFDIDNTQKSGEFYKMRRRKDLGLSTYDRHKDGSGVRFSSSKRPILNVRPGYIMWAFSRPREFSADLLMLALLEQEGVAYEILTDHDLHIKGSSALHDFSTVITGSHPEYPSPQSFAAYVAFGKRGGNLMYMGGNGFYWVSALDCRRSHRLELRRADVGVRPFTLPGGEHVNSLDGQRSGLWRSRGMSCNTVFGVGFCAQGTGPGVPFRRTEASERPEFAWIFQGVGDLLGEHGFGGSASGDEIDRYDVENGSPRTAVVLATSTGHSDEYGIATEDLTYPAIHTLGTQTSLIRSDVVYYVGSGGGAIFSVGSINWFCSMAWDNYDNDIARLTLNVLRGLIAGDK